MLWGPIRNHRGPKSEAPSLCKPRHPFHHLADLNDLGHRAVCGALVQKDKDTAALSLLGEAEAGPSCEEQG